MNPSPVITGKSRYTAILLSLPVLVGTIIGSIWFAAMPEHALWQNPLLRQGIGTDAAAFPFWRMLLELFGMSLLCLACCAWLGLSMAGAPPAICLLAFRGMAIGIALGRVYYQQGAAGLLTALLFVMPFALMGIVLLAMGVRESLRLSGSMVRLVRHGREEALSMRLYAVRFLVLASFQLAVSLLQCLWLRFGYAAYCSCMVD